jgi:hypothetical protein
MLNKYKHSRLALLLWTVLVFCIGYGNAALQRPKVEVHVHMPSPTQQNDAGNAAPMQQQITNPLIWRL